MLHYICIRQWASSLWYPVVGLSAVVFFSNHNNYRPRHCLIQCSCPHGLWTKRVAVRLFNSNSVTEGPTGKGAVAMICSLKPTTMCRISLSVYGARKSAGRSHEWIWWRGFGCGGTKATAHGRLNWQWRREAILRPCEDGMSDFRRAQLLWWGWAKKWVNKEWRQQQHTLGIITLCPLTRLPFYKSRKCKQISYTLSLANLHNHQPAIHPQ